MKKRNFLSLIIQKIQQLSWRALFQGTEANELAGLFSRLPGTKRCLAYAVIPFTIRVVLYTETGYGELLVLLPSCLSRIGTKPSRLPYHMC
jgi:hypothetical protein